MPAMDTGRMKFQGMPVFCPDMVAVSLIVVVGVLDVLRLVVLLITFDMVVVF